MKKHHTCVYPSFKQIYLPLWEKPYIHNESLTLPANGDFCYLLGLMHN